MAFSLGAFVLGGFLPTAWNSPFLSNEMLRHITVLINYYRYRLIYGCPWPTKCSSLVISVQYCYIFEISVSLFAAFDQNHFCQLIWTIIYVLDCLMFTYSSWGTFTTESQWSTGSPLSIWPPLSLCLCVHVFVSVCLSACL